MQFVVVKAHFEYTVALTYMCEVLVVQLKLTANLASLCVGHDRVVGHSLQPGVSTCRQWEKWHH